MANVFDQFDQPAQPAGNVFDQFDDAPKGAKATAADYLKGAAAGSNQLASGVGYLLEKAGATDTGKSLREVGQEGDKYWKDSMTPAGRRAATNQVFEDDPNSIIPRLGATPVQSALMGAAESAPSTVAMAIPGGIAAGALTRGAAGLAARGIGGATTAIAGGMASPVGVGSKIIAAAPSAIGMGASEGITSGAMNAAQTKDEIEQAPEEKLLQSPKYQELRRTMDANSARAALADMAGSDVFSRTAASTGVLGVLTGGGALGGAYRTATRGAKDGVVKELAKEIGNEAFQETVQSGPEQYIQNVAKRDYLDQNQNVMEGVVSGALSGGVTGGLMGGVMGGAGIIAGRQQPGVTVPPPAAGTVPGVPPTAAGPQPATPPAVTGAAAGSVPPAAGATPPPASVPQQTNSNQSVIDTVAQAVAAEEAAAANQQTLPGATVPTATQNAPAAPDATSVPVPPAAPTSQTNQAESAGAPIPKQKSSDPKREERATFYENMAAEREARGDEDGLRKAAEYRQTAANIRAGGAASPEMKGAATGGTETEKGIKAKKGRAKKSAETSGAGVVPETNTGAIAQTGGAIAQTGGDAGIAAATTSKPARKTAEELPNIRGTSENPEKPEKPENPENVAPAPPAPAKKPNKSGKPPPIMRRDDLVGAIMRVTGGDGIAANMALTIAGDKANAVTKLRGLFTGKGTSDLGEVAMLLREQEGFDVRDGEHLSELIRDASFGNVAVSMERQQSDKDAEKERQYRDRIRAKARKLGINGVAVKITDLESQVFAAEQARHDLAVEKLTAREKKRFDAAVAQLESLVSDAELMAILQDAETSGLTGRDKWQWALTMLRDFAADARYKELEGAIDSATQTNEEPDWFKDPDEPTDRADGNGSAPVADTEQARGRESGQVGAEQGGQPAGRDSEVLPGREEGSQGDREAVPGAFELAGQTTEEAAAAEKEKAAQANREEKARQAEEKAKKESADREEVKRRSESAASTFELGGDAQTNLSGQKDIFSEPAEKPAETPAPKPDPTTKSEQDLSAMFDAAMDDVFGDKPAAPAPKPEEAPPPAATRTLPPKSFRKQQTVTTNAYDADLRRFVQHETDADSALVALNDDIKAIEAFRACVAGG